MAAPGIQVPRRPSRGRFRWLSWVALTTAVAVAGLSSLDAVGRPAAPPMLRASFVGSRASTEVRLAPVTTAVAASTPDPMGADTAAPPTAAAPRPGPVDVPADPYAAENVVEIGSLEIAKLGVRQRLMQGVTLRNIDLGPSQWPGTALPGQPGNMVVAGHRVTHSRPFRNIDQLVPGDQVVVTAQGVQATYRVASSFVVTPDRTDIADPTPTPTLTLFACHPPGSARQRYVVKADLVATSAL